MFTNQKKSRLIRKRLRLLPKEPYEMTYWKEKLQSPFYRLQLTIKHFLDKRVSHS